MPPCQGLTNPPQGQYNKQKGYNYPHKEMTTMKHLADYILPIYTLILTVLAWLALASMVSNEGLAVFAGLTPAWLYLGAGVIGGIGLISWYRFLGQ